MRTPLLLISPLAVALTCTALVRTSAAQELERISLQDAVRRSLAQNVTSVIAAEEIRRAGALVEQVRAASLPTLSGNATYTHLDADRVSNGVVTAAQNSLGANATLTVPLVHPQHWAQWKHAKDNVEVARASDLDVKRQVAVAVGHSYLAIIAQKRVIDVTQRARDTAKAHYDFSHSRFVGGVGNRIDEVRAAQELATDEAQLHQALSGLVRVREALGVLLGANVPIDALDDPGLAVPPPLPTALQEAQTKRADVKSFETRVYAADRVVHDDWTDYSPYLVGIAQPFYQNPPTLTLPLTGWQAQLVLTLPLYDGGLRYGQAKERDVVANEARVQLDQTLRQARSDVRTAFEALREADDALVSARDAARLAEDALKLANLAYSAGATTNLEVIDAERVARDAETQAAIAEDTSRQARLDFLAACGRFP